MKKWRLHTISNWIGNITRQYQSLTSHKSEWHWFVSRPQSNLVTSYWNCRKSSSRSWPHLWRPKLTTSILAGIFFPTKILNQIKILVHSFTSLLVDKKATHKLLAVVTRIVYIIWRYQLNQSSDLKGSNDL